jgi:hypothetical protein
MDTNSSDSKITINDLVPEELRKGIEYNSVRDKMEQNLARPDKVNRYATHETGHLLYLIKTGFILNLNDAIFAGPTIYLEDGCVGQFSAAVSSKRLRLTDNTLVYTEEILNKAALAAAAASEFEKALLGEGEDTTKAETGDKTTLFKHCHKARSKNGIEFQGFTLWPTAQRETSAWPRENRAEVEGLVGIAKQVVFNRCFGLKAALSKADVDAVQNHSEVLAVLLLLLLESHGP